MREGTMAAVFALRGHVGSHPNEPRLLCGRSRRTKVSKISPDSMSARTSRRAPTGSVATERSRREAVALLDALRKVVRELRLASRAAEQQVGVHGAQLEVLQQLSDNEPASLT